jgi:hypothetical protein
MCISKKISLYNKASLCIKEMKKPVRKFLLCIREIKLQAEDHNPDGYRGIFYASFLYFVIKCYEKKKNQY